MIYKISVILITLCVVFLTVFGSVYFVFTESSYSEYAYDDIYTDDTYGSSSSSYLYECYEEEAVVVISLFGDIAWGVADSDASIYGAQVVDLLEEIQASDQYAGVVFEIDSPGGWPVASFRISELIADLSIPTATVIQDQALSGGYAIAAATDYIVAHPISDVGSIGVTMSYVNESKANNEQGYVYESLSTGSFKDTGDPSKELTEEERVFLKANLAEAHDYFVSKVAQYRNISSERMSTLADGRWYSGTEAVSLGLVDATGGMNEAMAYIYSKTGQENPTCDAPIF